MIRRAKKCISKRPKRGSKTGAPTGLSNAEYCKWRYKNETVNDAVRAISFRAMLETLSEVITETPINAPDSMKAQSLERARNYISTWQ